MVIKMTRIILSGCNGTMGKVVTACTETRADCGIAAGIDLNPIESKDFPVYPHISEVTAAADVIIDFSHPDALSGLLKYALERKLPVVLATTGLSPAGLGGVKAAAAEIPVFMSGNMSLGVNLLTELVKTAARVLGGSFDIEIVEAHHNRKIDAPSGTALMLAEAANDAAGGKYHYVYERESRREKREKSEIGIHSIRGGSIVGEHEVIFAGHGEVLTLSHSAISKEVFASGALEAALFLVSKAPGLYDMSDLVGAPGAKPAQRRRKS